VLSPPDFVLTIDQLKLIIFDPIVFIEFFCLISLAISWQIAILIVTVHVLDRVTRPNA
jgi:hypothetical protein